MQFLTDFADQAVMLPLIATVALCLAALGWRRGALAWLMAVGVSFALVVLLKLAFATCGPEIGLPSLRSPSGHTAAAAVVAGGLAALLHHRRGVVLLTACLAAALIGATRLVLGYHTPPEVLLGGAIGVAGALGFAALAGLAPSLRLRWLFAAVVIVAVLLHGQHLDAEPRIRAMAFSLPFCVNN
ncbi:MAG TPA: phosphatase PAP2 family protein [Acetobacteraceae bacterium]|jgi:membrane-associated phospholipid phosphatase|nr:phosphatase PAP2 family protein [Acetobacteraceae bacterium]